MHNFYCAAGRKKDRRTYLHRPLLRQKAALKSLPLSNLVDSLYTFHRGIGGCMKGRLKGHHARNIYIFTMTALSAFLFQNCGTQTSNTTVSPENPSGNPTQLVYNNLTFGTYPHKVDIILPPNRDANTRAVVMIHGGGGLKENFAYALGFKNTSEGVYNSNSDAVDGYIEDFLAQHNVALIFAQGQALPAKPESYTWSNTIMNSGQNDVAFLQLLAQELRQTWNFTKVYLSGHSMGGVMTNRMWCQSPTTFDGYGSISGPLSNQLYSSCNPSVKKPYIHITGLNDRILQIVEDPTVGPNINHATDTTLTLDSLTRTLGGVAFVHSAPEFRNELVSYSWRANLMCAETASAKVYSPIGTNWKTATQENCGGNLKMVQLKNRDHCSGNRAGEDSYKCDVAMTTTGTTEILDILVDFFE